MIKPISAAGSGEVTVVSLSSATLFLFGCNIGYAGLEASIEGQKDSFFKKKKRGKEVPVVPITVENAKIAVESRDNSMMQVSLHND